MTSRGLRTAAAALLTVAAVAILPTPAYADDLVSGQWVAIEEGSGWSWLFEIRIVGPDRYAGRVAEKDTDSPLCWPVGEDVMQLSGRDRTYTGTVKLYADGCTDTGRTGKITFDVDAAGQNAEIGISGCELCQTQLWTRPQPASPPLLEVARTWLLRAAGAVGALTVLIIVLVLLARSRRRARRRAAAAAVPAVSVLPRAGAGPYVVGSDSPPTTTITVTPRITLGRPTLQEDVR
ncbi:hypothetical protein ACFQZ4_37105 [Catellatospora coxensis]|uniref:DUF2147 domain-containing protein n=1 Tax=Catellatospora coxensis TaxID=310354 RepID=A0A8J3KJI7_9ACTN|nr:hypothetical protein [Catellatospora coxensis]GIG03788.1 hypothetical protein Cco03nite_04880 [Catellatospora coxensis]